MQLILIELRNFFFSASIHWIIWFSIPDLIRKIVFSLAITRFYIFVWRKKNYIIIEKYRNLISNRCILQLTYKMYKFDVFVKCTFNTAGRIQPFEKVNGSLLEFLTIVWITNYSPEANWRAPCHFFFVIKMQRYF